MKAPLAVGLLVPVVWLTAAVLPASAQSPSQMVPGVECEIDLSVLLTVAPNLPESLTGSSFVTTDSVLHCPGSTSGGVIRLECFEQVAYGGPRVSVKDTFRCDLTDEECDALNPTIAPADNRTLTLNSDGSVELTCQRNVVQ